MNTEGPYRRESSDNLGVITISEKPEASIAIGEKITEYENQLKALQNHNPNAAIENLPNNIYYSYFLLNKLNKEGEIDLGFARSELELEQGDEFEENLFYEKVSEVKEILANPPVLA